MLFLTVYRCPAEPAVSLSLLASAHVNFYKEPFLSANLNDEDATPEEGKAICAFGLYLCLDKCEHGNKISIRRSGHGGLGHSNRNREQL